MKVLTTLDKKYEVLSLAGYLFSFALNPVNLEVITSGGA
jgi:hypothetical protein